MTKKTVSIAKPSMGMDEWNALKEPILSGWIAQGEKVKEFEKQFAQQHNVKYAIAVSSGTAALHLSLLALGVESGDEVIVPSFSWVSTANAVLYCGAKPIFADIDRNNFNINTNDINNKITEKTKVIMPVHQFGLCCDFDQIRAQVPNHIKILEDAACATGGMYKENYAGSLGNIGAFSFHPRKPISTGEGGMITTNDAELANVVGSFRNHGINVQANSDHSELGENFSRLGFNYRLTDLQASIGIIQLKKLNDFIEERNKWASWYHEQFKNIDWLVCPVTEMHVKHSWQSFVIYVDPEKSPLSRNDLMTKLKEKGVETREGNMAIHMLPLYKKRYKICNEELPATCDCYMNAIAIPLHNCMDKADYEYVAETILDLVDI